MHAGALFSEQKKRGEGGGEGHHVIWKGRLQNFRTFGIEQREGTNACVWVDFKVLQVFIFLGEYFSHFLPLTSKIKGL